MSMTEETSALQAFAELFPEDEAGDEEAETEAPDEGQAEDDADTEDEAEYEADSEDDESDDDDDSNDDEAEPDEPQAIEIDFNGEIQRLTAKEIKAGFERHADYTRKTMALAKERESFETAAQQQVQQIRQQLAALQEFQEPPPDLSAERRDNDPIGYMQDKEAWNEKQAKRQQILQQSEAERQQRYQQQLQHGRDQLMAALPSWKDDAIRQKESAEITAALTSEYGFKAEELQGLADHRLVLLSRDAAKWRNLQKSKASVTKKAADKPRVSKPGSASKVNPAKSATDKARKTAQRTQSTHDWGRVFEDFV